MGSDPDEIERIHATVEAFAQAEDWPSALEFQIKLVLEEVGLNIINHGYDDENPDVDGHGVEITVASGSESVTLEITDKGRPFDLLTDAPPPDLQSGVEDRSVGGLGIHLVRTMMDEVRYRREGNMNHLTLVKRRS
jgi:anti-sigma regulatory factor (Ser/Thr protein kinase)